MNLVALLLLTAMLITYAILDGYDLGVGTMLYLCTGSSQQREKAIASIEPFWNGNEVWLIAGGGVLFAFFPRAYAVLLSGFYLPFVLILWFLIARGIAIELRNHYHEELWSAFWHVVFFCSSTLLALLFGIAIGNLIRGVPLDEHENFTGSFTLLLNPYALVIGLFTIFVLAQQGLCYLRVRVSTLPISAIVQHGLWYTTLVLDLVVTAWTYLIHPLGAPMIMLASMLGFFGMIALVLVGLFLIHDKIIAAFTASSIAIASMLAAAVTTIYPYLIVSSSNSPGLTIFDASPYGGTQIGILVVVILGLISVYGYVYYVLRTIKPNLLDDIELSSDTHASNGSTR